MTPAGRESRLTKAMKDHYLRKARGRADLPRWLFSDEELKGGREEYDPPDRRDRSRSRERSGSERSKAPRWATPDPVPQSRGLRDIYEEVSGRPPPPSNYRRNMDYDRNNDDGASKASSRLKALKEAKRGATSSGRLRDALREEEEDFGGRGAPPPIPRRRRPVGLPSAPAPRSR